MNESCKIQIHTLEWKGDHAREEGDPEPGKVSIYCRVFVNGIEIPQVARVRTRHQADDFGLAVVTMYGVIEMVNHTGESWALLDVPEPPEPDPEPSLPPGPPPVPLTAEARVEAAWEHVRAAAGRMQEWTEEPVT